MNKISIISVLLFSLWGCERDNRPKRRQTNLYASEIDSTNDYVEAFYKKRNWTYPVFIDTADSVVNDECHDSYIMHNRYNLMKSAFEILNRNWEHVNKIAYRLTHVHVYKDSGKIFFSLIVEKNKNNYPSDIEHEGATLLDSERIVAFRNRAIFQYNSKELSFVSWQD